MDALSTQLEQRAPGSSQMQLEVSRGGTGKCELSPNPGTSPSIGLASTRVEHILSGRCNYAIPGDLHIRPASAPAPRSAPAARDEQQAVPHSGLTGKGLHKQTQERTREAAEEKGGHGQHLQGHYEDGLHPGDGNVLEVQATLERQPQAQTLLGHQRQLDKPKAQSGVKGQEQGSGAHTGDGSPRTLLQHLRGDKRLSPELWTSLAVTPAGYRSGRDGCYRSKPLSPAATAVKAKQGSHIQFDHHSFPTGNGAALAEWPLAGRKKTSGVAERQGTLFQTLQWTNDAFSGGRSTTYRDAWLESYYKKGRRRAPPATEPRLEHNLRLVLKDLDGHLPPEATQRSSMYSRQRSGSGRGEGPPKPPHQDIKAVLRDVDGSVVRDAGPPPPGKRRPEGTEASRGRQDLFPVLQQQAPPPPGAGVLVGDRWLDSKVGKGIAAARPAMSSAGGQGGQCRPGDVPPAGVTARSVQSKRLVPGVQRGSDMKSLLFNWG